MFQNNTKQNASKISDTFLNLAAQLKKCDKK